MFTEIDVQNWDRKEIYDRFNGYTYCMTVDVDITRFLSTLREKEYKFYPSICYCIGKTVNENQDYRFGKTDGKVGYWDRLDVHYSLLRRNSNHLFTHMVTKYDADFPVFYSRFLEDKEKAEGGSTLYYNNSSPIDTVHISIMPNTTYKALSYAKPASYTGYLSDNTSYVPFVSLGKYYQHGPAVKLPVTVEFHHAVNDGYHAETFFRLFAECCAEF